MKTKLLLLISILLNIGIGTAQTFTKSIISNTNANGATGILEKEINGDGHMDLIGTSSVSNTVMYFINNGNGTFTQHIIDNNLNQAAYADAYDLDGDGDLDFTAVGHADLVWYENTGNFNFTRHNIATLNDPTFVRAYDVDSDGDGDIGVAIFGENYVSGFFNDGSGNFNRMNLISIAGPKVFNGGDFDGNGNADVLLSSFTGNEIAWYSFNGFTFIKHQVATGFNGAYGVEGSDLDGDGDYDIIAAASNNNEIAWFENSGDGSSFTKHTIDNSMPHAIQVHVIDIDGDGDKDVVATAFGNINGSTTTNHQVALYHNDGNQNFTKTVIDNSSMGPTNISVYDFTGNGTVDVAFASMISDEFVLLSNNSSAISEINDTIFSIYPNPARNIIRISSEQNIRSIRIFDLTGRKILDTQKRNISIERLPGGHYVVQVIYESGQMLARKLIKL